MPAEPSEDHGNYAFESAFSDAQAASAAQVNQPATGEPAHPSSSAAPSPSPPAAPSAAATAAAPPTGPSLPGVSEAPTSPQLTPYAIAAQEAGLPYEGLSDEQIAQQMAQLIVRTRPYANYGQQLAPYAEQIREYFAKQEEAPAAQPQKAADDEWSEDKYFTEKWNAPKWDDQYNFVIQQGMVQRNAETGLYEATPGFESMVMEVLPGLNRAQSWTAQQWTGITRGNPYRQFYDVLIEPMRHAWQTDLQRMVDERLQRQSVEQRVNSFEAENASWLYAYDQNTGTQILTPQGQNFYDEIANLREHGIEDPQTLIDLAARLTGVGSQRPASAAPIAPAAAVPPPMPAGPVNPQAANVAQQATFLQNALQRAAYSPQAGGYLQPAPDHPVSVDEGELNNMFVTEFRQGQGVGPR